MSSASYVISREPIRLGAIGLVGFFALLLLAVLFCILSFLLIGIPFFIATVPGWWLAYIFGMVAVFQVIGSKLARVMGKVDASQIAVVLGGGLAIGILHYFPLVGTLFLVDCCLRRVGGGLCDPFRQSSAVGRRDDGSRRFGYQWCRGRRPWTAS